jgi:hypothetical protein
MFPPTERVSTYQAQGAPSKKAITGNFGAESTKIEGEEPVCESSMAQVQINCQSKTQAGTGKLDGVAAEEED